MCIDAPESTTNSLSSGFDVDAGKNLFSGDEENAALSCSFNLNTFLASFHAGFAGTLLLPLCVNDPHWCVGAAFTWTNVTKRGIFLEEFCPNFSSPLSQISPVDRDIHR